MKFEIRDKAYLSKLKFNVSFTTDEMTSTRDNYCLIKVAEKEVVANKILS